MVRGSAECDVTGLMRVVSTDSNSPTPAAATTSATAWAWNELSHGVCVGGVCDLWDAQLHSSR